MEEAMMILETVSALSNAIANAATAQQKLSNLYAKANASNNGKLTADEIKAINDSRESAVASADKALEVASKLPG